MDPQKRAPKEALMAGDLPPGPGSPPPSCLSTTRALKVLHGELAACRACPNMIGPVVHGPPIASKILLVGQAPGPREGSFGRPFAWTAGRTLFRWFEEALGASDDEVRSKIYFAAVARCFPGKAKGGGDRRPDADEIGRCRSFLARETAILSPELVLPVGTLAIEQVLGPKAKLVNVVGAELRARYHDVEVTVIGLPHPSGVSTWHKMEPGKTLLGRAMDLIAQHPAVRAAFPSQGRRDSYAADQREHRPGTIDPGREGVRRDRHL